jgi:hypothetical protein
MIFYREIVGNFGNDKVAIMVVPPSVVWQSWQECGVGNVAAKIANIVVSLKSTSYFIGKS